ncbi:hypothetical protein HC928_05680 [bacterium]|nr:hypothetical protein [bacterium]
MPAPLRSVPASMSRLQKRRGRRPASLQRKLARHTPVIEISARLAVNGLLVIVAFGTLSQLVPYLRAQAQRLAQVNEAVETATASNVELKAEFGRYFDPSQTSQLMQEYSGYQSPQQRQVVWTAPTRP